MTHQEFIYNKQHAIEENKNPLRKFEAICKKELIVHNIGTFYKVYKENEIYPCNISEGNFITIIRVFNQNKKYPICIEISKESFDEYFTEIINI